MEPLFLTPVMHEKLWGGNHLETVFHYAIPSQKTGECWAISAHPNGVTTVANGQYKGRGLDDLYQNEKHLFGNPTDSVFPLLTKILDANEWLSVQVHPDDAYSLAHEGELGKTECWYVLEAEEGAEIIYGHTAHTKEELAQLIQAGNWKQLLTHVPVKKGDFFFVPSGTMHAIGKGIMILETQQSSDTTYRVYDFDRLTDDGQLRELHIDKSIDVLTIGPVANSTTATLILPNLESTLLVANPFFTVYKWIIKEEVTMQQSAPYLLISVIDGKGAIKVNTTTYPLQKGDHFILPANVTEWTFTGQLELISSHTNKKT
ncbi:mannose-6-phosphate isomerase, class I [Streptococcus suis]|nr:mannose-6-phosphate isomerase, class I [Streptococcus suis]